MVCILIVVSFIAPIIPFHSIQSAVDNDVNHLPDEKNKGEGENNISTDINDGDYLPDEEEYSKDGDEGNTSLEIDEMNVVVFHQISDSRRRTRKKVNNSATPMPNQSGIKVKGIYKQWRFIWVY